MAPIGEMLVFHPALDPNHAAFRFLQLSSALLAPLEKDHLRALDFYLAFPHALRSVRLPPKLRREKNLVAGKPNPYSASGEPRSTFMGIAPIQEQGLRLLYGKGILDRDAFLEGTVAINKVPVGLWGRVMARVHAQAELIDFIVNVLGALPFYGDNGLKHRTRLLEHRYDAV